MNLSMSFIAKYLEKYDLEVHIAEDAKTIRGVRFFTDQPNAHSLEYVYLGKASDYFQDPRYADALLLANAQNQIVCRGADYETLLNDVLTAFDYYAHFEQQLYTAAADHRPLQDMMDIIAAVVPFPFFVFDIDGNLLGMCHEKKPVWDDFISDFHLHSLMGSHTIGQIFIDSNGQILHDLSDYPQYLHIDGQEDNSSVSMYLYQDGERIGYALLFVSQPLELLYVAYQQCLFALGADPKAGIRCCQDLAMPYLLQNLRSTPMCTHLLHPIIGILQKYDEESDAQMLETLRVYLRCGCRQAEAAQKLHIHLNTLKYRLRSRSLSISHITT